MALKIKPVQASALTLAATPYVGAKLWTEGVALLHQWAANFFEPGDVFPDFIFAETLKVHRVIADLWLLGLIIAKGAVDTKIYVGSNKETFAHGFRVLPCENKGRVKLIVPQELREYDPWTDRSLDKEIPEALYADLFIDKYYDVFINEYFIALNQPRRRPDGRTFQPLDMSEHPRYAEDTAKTKKQEGKPPPQVWRALIDELAST